MSVDSPQLQGPKFDQTHSSGPHGAHNASISSFFRGVLLPEGLEITNEVSEKYTSLEKNVKKSLNSDRPCRGSEFGAVAKEIGTQEAITARVCIKDNTERYIPTLGS